MKLESFNDVLASIGKNPKRAFHLLLGNGFSVAYDPAIFSYNALHNFVAQLNDDDLSKALEVIETRNFEVIMQYLDHFSALLRQRRLCGLDTLGVHRLTRGWAASMPRSQNTRDWTRPTPHHLLQTARTV
jgi:hypothetical protein